MNIPIKDLSWFLRYWLGIILMWRSYDPLFISGIAGFADYLDSLSIPMAKIMAYVAKSAEFFGGLMIVLNLWTRLFAVLVIIVMAVAVFVAHKGLILTEAELAFNYLLLAILLFFNPNIPFKIFKSK